ncbi:Uu.00g026950.m01.CDS01 [Anthostomella pinea]|uniref:ubiquitinyl hydrolase 1 n=1 Tax=Anthostomella pinea TaxID=933095 RepID=A0AAI8V875_9PEZI|nr:Uu.00g026950.m01.CDS01 [Anthostomella pinea]
MLSLYAELHGEMRDAKGLVLTSHEHLLSYKLGGWQHLADGKLGAARYMVSFQNWLNNHCRDVLDECDFTLSVKTQLNYPSGPEMTVDGHPFRWQVALGLLALASHHIPLIRDNFPGSIEILRKRGSFPMVYFLKSSAEDALHERILDEICAGRTTFLRPADSFSSDHSKIIRRVLTDQSLDHGSFTLAVKAFSNPQAASKMLLVVRGLLLNRILLCLNKRWNVQYGLHPQRHPIAVPFEAKGVPSEQSEFGHPDVAILFTCLAFYHTGLTSEQFRKGLQHVLQSDDPAAQYEHWTSSCNNLPEELRHWNVINLDDGSQMEDLWRQLQLDRVVVDHYLNNFVFPKYARQFEIKLQASGWDIPLVVPDKEHGAKTTGFSGQTTTA